MYVSSPYKSMPDMETNHLDIINRMPEPEVYFLVRWRPPYHFTMMEISHKPWPRCTQEDREADEWRTVFATQEWRQ